MSFVHEVVGERARLRVEHEPPVLPALHHIRELVELPLEGGRDLFGIGGRRSGKRGRGGAAAPVLARGHRAKVPKELLVSLLSLLTSSSGHDKVLNRTIRTARIEEKQVQLLILKVVFLLPSCVFIHCHYY